MLKHLNHGAGFGIMGHFDHRLMLIGVQRQAMGGHLLDAMLAKHLVQLAARGLDPGQQRLQTLILAQIGGNGVDRLSATLSISRAKLVLA